MGVSIGILLLIAAFARRYTRSVADFLAVNRCAGRYLLTVSEWAGAIAIVSFVAQWQTYYETGFGGLWWIWKAVIDLKGP